MINAFVQGQRLKISQPIIAADTINYLEAEFHFQTKDWAGAEVWAHFYQGEVHLKILLDNGCINSSKHLDLTVGNWEVYLQGRWLDGKQATTTIAKLTVEPTGALTGDGSLPEKPPSEFEQLVQQAKDAKTGAETAQSAAEAAAQEAKTAAEGVKDISAQVEQVKGLTQRAEAAAGTAADSQAAAAESAQSAKGSMDSAGLHAQHAGRDAGLAATSAQQAETAAGTAVGAAGMAGQSAEAAAGSASEAAADAQTATEAVASIGTSVQDARTAANTATQAADRAKTEAGKVSTALEGAAGSAAAAAQSAQEAAGSAGTANDAAGQASAAAQRAGQAESDAKTWKDQAIAAYRGAEQSASEASGFAGEAYNSAGFASQSATTATEAADRAAASEQTATTAAGTATTQAGKALAQANRAKQEADRAGALIDDTTISTERAYSSSKIYETFCPPMDVSGKVITVYPAGDYPMELTTVFTAVQTGTGPASPTNIRAIKGFTGAKISQMGENQYDFGNVKAENAVTVQPVPNGFRLTKTNKTQYASGQITNIRMVKGQKYTVRATIKHSTEPAHSVMSVTKDGAFRGAIYDDRESYFLCDETGVYAIRVYVNFNDSKVGDYTDFTNVTITTTAPFNEYTIDFGRTAYTAEYHWNSGQLVLKSEILNFRGAEIGAYSFGGSKGVRILGRMTQIATRASGLCTHATVSGPNRIGIENPSWIWAGVNDNIVYWLDILDILKISLEKFRDEWIQQNNVFMLYELPNPIIVQLTPAEIRNLPGGNTFISDIGDTRVLGRESFAHAFEEINKKIEALQKATLGGM